MTRKRTKTKKTEYIPANEAAKLMEVDCKTVILWVKKGRLRGKIRKVLREIVTVDESSLKNAFDVECVWCHKIFKSTHPEQAKYCCRQHKDLYRYHVERKK